MWELSHYLSSPRFCVRASGLHEFTTILCESFRITWVHHVSMWELPDYLSSPGFYVRASGLPEFTRILCKSFRITWVHQDSMWELPNYLSSPRFYVRTSGLPEFTTILCEIGDSLSLVVFCVVSFNRPLLVLLSFHLVISLSGFLWILITPMLSLNCSLFYYATWPES